MRAIILAAGKGIRLLPLTATIPKPLLMVGPRPLLEHVLLALPDVVDEVTLVVGHLGEQIKDRFGDRFAGKRLLYIFQERLNGTGGAMALAKHVVKGPTLVLNADDLYTKDDLTRLVRLPRGILAKRTREKIAYPLRIGWLRRWLGFEKPSLGNKIVWQNCGAYVLDEQYFLLPPVEISVRGKFEASLPHTLACLTSRAPIYVVEATTWLPVGTIEELTRANARFGVTTSKIA